MKRETLTAALLLTLALPSLGGNGGLTLGDYQAMALRGNRDLRSAILAEEAADQARKGARTGYFPKAGAGGAIATTNILPGAAVETPLLPDAANKSNSVSVGMVTVQQPLFAGGRIVNGNRLADTGLAAARHQLRIKSDETKAQAEKKYRLLKVLAAKKKTLLAYERMINSLYDQVSQAAENGLVTKTDVLRVGLKKSEIKVNKSILEKSTALAENDFRFYAGMPSGEEILLAEEEETVIEPSFKAENLPALVRGRAEYGLAESGLEAARLQTKVKRGEYMPALSVGAGLYRGDYLNGKADYQNSVAFGMVSIPLNFWEAAHTVKEMKLKENAAAERLKYAEDYLLLDLQSLLKEYEQNFDKVRLAETAMEEARANRSEIEDGYKNGTEKLSDLLEAMALEQESEDRLSGARADYFQARTAFTLAAGIDSTSK